MTISSPLKSEDTLNNSRFSPITDNDKAGILWIASLLSGIYAILSLIVRVYIKRRCFGYDDGICVAATIAGVGSFAAIFAGLSEGLGKSFVRNPETVQRIEQAVFGSRLAFVFAVSLAKASVTFLIKRLFSQDMSHHRMLCNIVLAVIALWMLGSVVGLSIDCLPHGLVTTSTLSCTRQFLRWEIIGILDSITELIIILLSCGLVWRLQMRIELKIRVLLAFIFRLPLVAIAAVHVYYVHAMPLSEPNLHIIPVLAVEQIQIGYALVSATIPNLKSFIMSFDTAMMMDFDDYKVCPADKSRSALRLRRNPGSLASIQGRRYSDMSTQDELIGSLRLEHVEHRSRSYHVDSIESKAEDLPSSRRENG